MRVLFASLGSAGHTYPMMPLAVAAREAGHEVHFAAGEHMHQPLAAHGLRPFRPADAFYEIYAEDIEPDLARLRPDLVVHGWGLPGPGIAAQRAGIPTLWHGFGRLFPDGIGLEMPGHERPHVDICPPSLQDKDFLTAADRLQLRPAGSTPAAGSDRIVFLSFGTAFGTAELLTTAIEALAPLGAPVVVAAGRVPPNELDNLPPNVSVHAWAPQSQLLPRADLVVHHGGSGTMLGALAAGAPQLILPQGADQFTNADAVTASGAGLRLLAPETSVDAIAGHARELLAHNAYRAAAREIAAEIARMPSPADVARRLPDYAA